LPFVGIVGLTFCLIAVAAGLRLAKEYPTSPWPMIFVSCLGVLVLIGIVYTHRPFEWPF
jgi:1,4-dihydroxy-2-naphthoate octaprenyltransferase